MFETDLGGLKKRASAEADGLVMGQGAFRDADAIGRLACEVRAVGYREQPALGKLVVAELEARAAAVRCEFWGG